MQASANLRFTGLASDFEELQSANLVPFKFKFQKESTQLDICNLRESNININKELKTKFDIR